MMNNERVVLHGADQWRRSACFSENPGSKEHCQELLAMTKSKVVYDNHTYSIYNQNYKELHYLQSHQSNI